MDPVDLSNWTLPSCLVAWDHPTGAGLTLAARSAWWKESTALASRDRGPGKSGGYRAVARPSRVSEYRHHRSAVVLRCEKDTG